jgi:hypothetical protein
VAAAQNHSSSSNIPLFTSTFSTATPTAYQQFLQQQQQAKQCHLNLTNINTNNANLDVSTMQPLSPNVPAAAATRTSSRPRRTAL